ncbi:MAG: single-stranded-DNA-specific exonuclease RecJ, partial [Flavobacteriales bacterium]|nr:single-stranded-DNA-specific exonuclease RecJ [Flavobacteriales bacterium]
MTSSSSTILVESDLEWTIASEIDASKIQAFQKQFPVSWWIAQILLLRDLQNQEHLDKYFRPRFQSSHDPMKLKGMDKALELLKEAIFQQKKIMVYGDYDVDGTTAVSMMSDFLWQHEALFIPYIPDRYEEGYGVSAKGIDTAIEQGVHLLITLDCGIRAVEHIERARTAGIDVIVCDHHEPGEALPKANAILNPKQADCDYPFDGLSGAGVAFKLIHAFAIDQGYDDHYMERFLDLLALSIAADIVPVIDENRTFLILGLQRLNSKDVRPGFKALLDAAKFSKEKVNLGDLLFVIAPRINAAGRLKTGQLAVEVLRNRGDDLEALRKLAQELEETNQERRSLDEGITAEALEQCTSNNFFGATHSNVVSGKEWHKGVVGIVASRLIESHYKPSIVLAEHDGVLSGSVRSIYGLDVHEALKACSHLLDRFGGHAMAAGLSLAAANLAELRLAFDAAIKKQKPQLPKPSLLISAELKPGDIDKKSFVILENMEPFGPKNSRPLFLSKMVLL